MPRALRSRWSSVTSWSPTNCGRVRAISSAMASARAGYEVARTVSTAPSRAARTSPPETSAVMTWSTAAPMYRFRVMTVIRVTAGTAAVDAKTTRPRGAGPVTLESEQAAAKTRDSNSGTRVFMAVSCGSGAEHSPRPAESVRPTSGRGHSLASPQHVHQPHEQERRRDPGRRGVLEDDRSPLGAHPIPVVEAEADVGGGEDARARVGDEAQPSRAHVVLQLIPAHVHRHAVLARAERHEHRERRPPDVSAVVKEAVDAVGGGDEEEAREDEPVHEEVALEPGLARQSREPPSLREARTRRAALLGESQRIDAPIQGER